MNGCKCYLAALQPLKLKNCPNPIFIKGIIAENVLDNGCPTPSIFLKDKKEINFIWIFCFHILLRLILPSFALIYFWINWIVEFVSLIFNCGKIHFVGEKNVRGFLEMRVGCFFYILWMDQALNRDVFEVEEVHEVYVGLEIKSFAGIQIL